MAKTLIGRGGGAGGHNMKWYYDTLTPGMATFAAKMAVVTHELMDEMVDPVQEYMRTNAPWEDQTGAARDGLTAETARDGLDFVMVLYHTVDYGIWLEIKHSGQYAIIIPTLEMMGPEIMLRLQGAFALL